MHKIPLIIITTEYDPLEPNRRAIKARVGRLRDPCSRVLEKRAEENGLLSEEGETCKGSKALVNFDIPTYEVSLLESTTWLMGEHITFTREVARRRWDALFQESPQVARSLGIKGIYDLPSFQPKYDVFMKPKCKLCRI